MKFEYKLVHYKAEGWVSGGKVDVDKIGDEYNAHGQDGWELVSVMDTNKNNGQSDLVIAFFKRAID